MLQGRRMLVLFAALSCAAHAGRAAGAAPAEDSGALAAALDRALLGAVPAASLELGASCGSERGYRSADVFGRGVGIWNGRGQFELDRKLVLRLLRLLRDARFAEMPDVYGGASPGAELGVKVICRVSLAIGGRRKTAAQLEKGTQSAELGRLANAILDACEKAAHALVGAATLGDGLEKLAAGSLAPETFELSVLRRPEGPDGAAGESWQLRVEGRGVSATGAATGSSPPEAARIALSRAEFVRLARRLVELRAAGLPINLYARDYVDLRLRVLDREMAVQARRFAGMTPERHGARQSQFDELLDELDALRLRAVAEGKSR